MPKAFCFGENQYFGFPLLAGKNRKIKHQSTDQDQGAYT
jgi:hypothetical protein